MCCTATHNESRAGSLNFICFTEKPPLGTEPRLRGRDSSACQPQDEESWSMPDRPTSALSAPLRDEECWPTSCIIFSLLIGSRRVWQMPHKESGLFSCSRYASAVSSWRWPSLPSHASWQADALSWLQPPLDSNHMTASPFPFRSRGGKNFPRLQITGCLNVPVGFLLPSLQTLITVSSFEPSGILLSTITLADLLPYIHPHIMNPNHHKEKWMWNMKSILGLYLGFNRMVCLCLGFQSWVYNFLAQWPWTNQLT